MENEDLYTEVLTFRNGLQVATIVTDGRHHRSYEWEFCQEHPTLQRAISYLEKKGYSVDTGEF